MKLPATSTNLVGFLINKTMRKIVLEEGKKYGRLTFIKEVSSIGKRRMILCKCECGNIKEYSMDRVLHGRTRSCGCIRSEMLSKYRKNEDIPRKYVKEIRYSRLYRIWNAMKGRCYTRNSGGYSKYGAKGIRVCDEWRTDFMSFYNWALSNGYSDNLTIDRIDYTGNYEPSNCRWATLKEQANNKSNVILLEHNGEKRTISEWSEITGISAKDIWQRINRLKWPIEKALTKPVRDDGKHNARKEE